MREEITRAIGIAVSNSSPPPQNETETCHRIVFPLLLAAGYGYLEIRAQDSDAAKQKPDYTILPDSPDYTWFLEAKAWNVKLDDNHAVQAINYANTQGKRWVVLSNGREWRLYDNQTFGTADVKLACKAQLTDDSFAGYMEALSKGSVTQGRLEHFVRNQRLYLLLGSQIARPESEVIRAITRVLKGSPGLSAISGVEVVRFFEERATEVEVTTAKAESLGSTGKEPGEVAPKPQKQGGVTAAYKIPRSLDGFDPGRKSAVLFSKVVFSDGCQEPASKWYHVLVAAATCLVRSGKITTSDCPVDLGGPKRYILNTVPSHKRGDPFVSPVQIGELWLETHFSARGCVRNATKLLKRFGVSPRSVTLQ